MSDTVVEITLEQCQRCFGDGKYLVPCCFPKPLSQIHCCCGYTGGYEEFECEECEGTGSIEIREMKSGCAPEAAPAISSCPKGGQ